MSPETKSLAALCSDVANQAADPQKFVPVGRLVELLGADLAARPLLVEGMLAEPTAGGKWLVLVDSDSGSFIEKTYREERSGHSLPPRLRFTIAHELGHLIQLQSEAPKSKEKRRTAKSTVRNLEKEADKLSPLLLVAEAALEEFCSDEKSATLDDFISARHQWGISREVLVQRLNLLLEFDRRGLRHKPRIRNKVVGIGEWPTAKEMRILDWPKPFWNLDDNLAPAFLLRKEITHDELKESFPSPGFCFNGGTELVSDGKAWVGTSAWPKSEQRSFRLTIEDLGRRTGKFLYLLDGAPLFNSRV